MMKIFAVSVPPPSAFAGLRSIYVEPQTLRCTTCRRRVVPDLLVEWEDGSDVVGDFTEAGGRTVVKSLVADELLGCFGGLEKRPLEMLDHPDLYRPKRITRRTPVRIWLPYEGPPLCELRVTREVPLTGASTVTISRKCTVCGAIVYRSFDGVERKNSKEHVPRTPGKGLFVRRKDIEGVDFFKPEHTGGLTLCTEEVRAFITAKGYSNVEFLEMGDIVN